MNMTPVGYISVREGGKLYFCEKVYGCALTSERAGQKIFQAVFTETQVQEAIEAALRERIKKQP